MKLLMLLVSLFGVTQVYAYSPSTHEMLSYRAVREYNFCITGNKEAPLTAEQAKLIADGNIGEDSIAK